MCKLCLALRRDIIKLHLWSRSVYGLFNLMRAKYPHDSVWLSSSEIN
jgi:hypothetical protein